MDRRDRTRRKERDSQRNSSKGDQGSQRTSSKSNEQRERRSSKVEKVPLDSRASEKRKSKSHRKNDGSEERKGSIERRRSNKSSEHIVTESSSRNNTNGHGEDNDKRSRHSKDKRRKDNDEKGSRGKEERRHRDKEESRSKDKDEKRRKDREESKTRSKEDIRSKDREERKHRQKDDDKSKSKDSKSKDRDRKMQEKDELKYKDSKSSRRREEKSDRKSNGRDEHSKEKKMSSKSLNSAEEMTANSKISTETKPNLSNVVNESESEVKLREAAMIEALKSKEEEEEPDYNYDEEEFDDYDDDFESEVEEDDDDEMNEFSSGSYDDSDSYIDSESPQGDDAENDKGLSEAERLQIREAMVLENSRVGSSSPAMLPSSPANTPIPGSPANEVREKAKQKRSARGLDFASAQKTQAANKALSKTAQRGNDLMRLIEMDTIYFDLFELKPQTEYELFMRSFGRSETHQKYTQYNEDSIDKETSTETSDTKTCWTQHPIETSLASAHEGEDAEKDESGRYDPLSLSKFVSLSSQVIFTLLEERASRHGYTHTFKPVESSKISNTSAQFPPNQIAAGRSPIFSFPITAQMFATCYSKSKTDSLINNAGLSCTWNLQNVYEPVSVLISNSAHRCACVSSYNQNVVFVGCEDGSICLWDLNESESMHKKYQLNNKHFVGRLPTYSTSAIQVAESHNSKITSIQPIRFDQEQVQMSSYQIASLDEHGVIVIWVVLSVVDSSFSGSQTDLGLRPGGKTKLVKSAAINTNFPQHAPELFPELRTYAFQQSYSDTNMYFVATDKGAVLKTSRGQSLSHPNYYCEEHAVPCIVGSIDFNRFNWKYFLTGSSDGSISLYSVGRSSPLVMWDRSTRGRPIRSVRWSQYSSTIFYVMDSANRLYMWDLSVRDSTPLVIESYDQKGLLSFTELLPSAGSTSPVLVLGFKDGSLEAHQVKEEAMNNKINNISKLESYLRLVL